jgi:hypothetical protein
MKYNFRIKSPLITIIAIIKIAKNGLSLYGILHGFLKLIIRLPNQYDYKLTSSLITTANIEYTRLLIVGWMFFLKS